LKAEDGLMAEDLMRYDQLTQNALRGVVRDALRHVKRQGLPGEHHFYIAFNTRYPNVSISERLLQRYPREMTIVLQHQYSDLEIHEDWFQVVLFFDQIAEKLVVPFAALKGFLDPSVQFGLQFEVVSLEQQKDLVEKPVDTIEPKQSKSKSKKADVPPPAEEDADNTPKVVSLDAFRKK
jgi:uncharacterized protein